MQNLLLIYILVASTASALFVMVGRRNTRVALARPIRSFSAEQPPNEPNAEATTLQPQGNIETALAVALGRLSPIIARRQIKMDVLVSPDLIVELSPPVIASSLEKLIFAVIRPLGVDHLLLTAWQHDHGIAVRLIDDLPAADPDMRKRSFRNLIERIGAHCGILDIDIQPCGTAVTIWLTGLDRVPIP